MSENTQQARTVTTNNCGKLDLQALVLLAILLAAGFILNFTVGKAISSISGGMISPEFIISAFCLTILVVRPNIGQALVIGLISAAVIQLTTTSPFIDFAAEGVAAMLMAGIVGVASKKGSVSVPVTAVATFVTTAVSGRAPHGRVQRHSRRRALRPRQEGPRQLTWIPWDAPATRRVGASCVRGGPGAFASHAATNSKKGSHEHIQPNHRA